MAQLFVAAENVRPAPIPPATRPSFGETNLLPRTPARTSEPAAMRTCRSRAQTRRPLTTSPPAASYAGTPPVRTLAVERPAAPQLVPGLFGPVAGLAHEDDAGAQLGGEFGGVLAEQTERDVVRAFDVQGFELGAAADVDDHQVIMVVLPACQG